MPYFSLLVTDELLHLAEEQFKVNLPCHHVVMHLRLRCGKLNVRTVEITVELDFLELDACRAFDEVDRLSHLLLVVILCRKIEMFNSCHLDQSRT